MNKKHEFKARVRYSEIDGMKFVHNSKYLVFFEEARVDLVRVNNYPYSQMESDGIFFPVSESNIKYKKPLLYDESITVIVEVEYIKLFSMKFLYEIIKEDNTIACEGFTIHACIDNKTNKLIELPEKIINIFKNYLIK